MAKRKKLYQNDKINSLKYVGMTFRCILELERTDDGLDVGIFNLALISLDRMERQIGDTLKDCAKGRRR